MNVQYFLNYKTLQERDRENVTRLSTITFVTFSLMYRIWCVNGTACRDRTRESGWWKWLNVVSDG